LGTLIVRARGARLTVVVLVTLVLVSIGRVSADDYPGYTELRIYERNRAVDPRLTAALRAADPAIAARAALALGRTKDRRAVDPVLRFLRTVPPDPAVRAMTVYAAGLLSGEPTPPAIFVSALADTSSAVRVAACDAAARYVAYAMPRPGAGAVTLLVPLMRTAAYDPEPIVRSRAAVALVEYAASPKAGTVVATLTAIYVREKTRDVRRHIAWTLGRGYATIVSRTFLQSQLRDPDDVIRIAALRALGRLRDRSLTPGVTPLLADPSWRVQEEAGETLRMLRGEARSEHLTALMPGLHLPAESATAGATDSLWNAKGRHEVEAALLPRTAALMTGPMPGAHPRVRLTTTQGEIIVRLYPEWAPHTVENFLALTARKYYDGLRLFRIVPDFVVQTGDPSETGNGDAGYRIPAEENPLEQHEGVLSMGLDYDAAGPIRDSAGTQFYLTLSPQYHLDRAFTVFGETIAGFNVLARLVESDRLVRVERITDEEPVGR